MWLFGRTLRTSDYSGMTIWFWQGTRENWGQWVCIGDRRPIQYLRSYPYRGKPRLLLSSQCFWTLSTMRASCRAVLCLGLNPNYSAHPLTLQRILESGIFSNSLPIVSSRLIVDKIRTGPCLSRFSGSKTRVRAFSWPGCTAFESRVNYHD